ncbi:hypothetical protein K504DRAFT_342872, partial [Pleomassaria siparia CBS 279.74]
SPPNLHPSMQSYHRDGPRDGPGGMSLPPLRQMTSTPPTPSSERRSGNPLGVHDILNPQADIMEQHRNRRHSGSQRESMSPIESHPSHSLPSISRPPSVDSTQVEPLSNRQFQPPNRLPARHLLSPRSPNIHRTQSVGVLGAPTGTIDAHQSPFLSASTRPYGADAVTSQSAGSAPPVGVRATYLSKMPPSAPTPPPSMIRNDFRRPSVSFPQSGSASPMASYSPYSRPASIASSHFENNSQQSSYMTGQNNAHQDSHNPPIAMETERSRIPMAPSAQSSIQMMTIKSQQGHHVQIPVDVQAASKVADEKRKRNAGASARFRARRKEKEREASMSISRLQEQIRHATEDVDYYRTERDYFKAIVFSQSGAERHYARPPSPRLRRTSMPPSIAPSTLGGGSAGSLCSDYDDDDEPEPERNVRRRTSNYHPASGAPQDHFNGTGPPPQSYTASSFSPVNNPPMNQLPLQQQFDSREQRPHAELQQAAGQRPPLRGPFEAARYENRNW